MSAIVPKTSSAAVVNAGTVTCAYPAGSAPGDFVLVAAVLNGGDKTLTPPANLTQVFADRDGALSSDGWLYIWKRQLVSGDFDGSGNIAAATFTASAATKIAVVMYGFTGVDQTTPIGTIATPIKHATAVAQTDFPAINYTAGQEVMLLSAFIASTLGSWGSPPSGYSLFRTQYTQAASQLTWLRLQPTPTASGTSAAQTMTNTLTGKGLGVALVMNPASNVAPTANAGPDQAALGGQTLTMGATGSDVDAGDTLTGAWTQTGGTGRVRFADVTSPTTQVVMPAGPDVVTLRWTETDSHGATAYDEMQVTVNAAPLVRTDLAGDVTAPANTDRVQLLVRVLDAEQGELHYVDDVDVVQ